MEGFSGRETMGGYGSGQWQTERQTVESSLTLAADYVVRQFIGYHQMTQPTSRPIWNVMTWTRGQQTHSITVYYRNLTGAAPELALDYVVTRIDGQRTPVKTKISFTAVDYTNEGRAYVRWFFRCPTCNRRVSKLYQPPGKVYFMCRHCHKLKYAEQLETRPPAHLARLVELIDLDRKLDAAFEKLHGSRRKRRQRIGQRIDRLYQKTFQAGKLARQVTDGLDGE
jgi:hypothetical protein